LKGDNERLRLVGISMDISEKKKRKKKLKNFISVTSSQI